MEEECLLCGEPSKLRCASCNSAGISLFFCTKEHQTAAWPVHKLVCGKRAHPFILSPFEQSEADRIVQVLATRAGDEVEASLQSIARMALDAEDTTVAQKKAKADAMVGQSGHLSFMIHWAQDYPGLESRRPDPVYALRWVLSNWYRSNTSIFGAGTVPFPESMVFDHEQTVRDLSLHGVDTASAWYSHFLHRLSSHLSVVSRLTKAMKALAPPGAEWTGHSPASTPATEAALALLDKHEAMLLRFLERPHPSRPRALAEGIVRRRRQPFHGCSEEIEMLRQAFARNRGE